MNTPWEILSAAITRLGDRIDALPTVREASVAQIEPLAIRFDTDLTNTLVQGTLSGALALNERVLTIKLRHYVWILGRRGGLLPWSAVSGKPSAFAPTAHQHSFADIMVAGYLDISQWVSQNHTQKVNGFIPDAQLPVRIQPLGRNVSNGNMNDLIESGFYRGSQMANAPAGHQGWWYVLVQAHDTGSWRTQMAIGYAGADQQIWTRQQNSGNYGAWARMFDPGATPHAESAGKVSLTTLAAGGSQTVAVTFPSGRFSQPPIVTLQSYTTRYTLQVSDGSVTASGFTMIASNFSGAGASSPSAFTWTALQMGVNGSAG